MRRATVWAGLPVVALALTGCSVGETRQDVAYGVDQPVRVLVVEGSTGDIEVVGGGDAVSVTERQEYRGAAPQTRHRVEDGTLTLSYSCGDCSVDYRVRVPEGTVVRLSSSTGDVRVSGLAGAVDAQTGTGSVEASGLGPASVRLESGTGDVVASFRAAPREVTASSSTGDVRVVVPGGQPYAVDADSGAGDVRVDLARSAGAERRISARTGAGDVTVSGA
ncbi:DUF4097 family beta strand repeat-containing protein [Kitasatospora sp. NPDC048365]|uniref:DUF4097 family beta strand repeat-containing protein n=1 Tax=Kitasatospora sp. NPDC048365 TaxID=3364050 RepID=UPI003719FCB9